MKKYGFKLKLPFDIEIDSVEEIEGHCFWPNYSHAEPIIFKGIFNTKEEARKYAEEFKVYKYIIHAFGNYDSFEDDDDCLYYLSHTDAEDAACFSLGISSEWPVEVTRVVVEEITSDEGKGTGKYKFFILIGEEIFKDSVEEGVPPFESEEDAYDAGVEYDNNIDINKEIVDIVEIEILGIEITEIECDPNAA